MITVMILSSVIVIIMGAASLVVQGIRASRNQEFSTTAYFAAEAGAERALWEIRKNDFTFTGCASSDCIRFDSAYCQPLTFSDVCCSPCTDNSTKNVIGNAEYQLKYSTSTTETILLSSGNYSGITRSVQISFPY